jgi:hypothetical protein
MKNSIQFSSQQKECIRKGALKRQGLIREAQKAAQKANGREIREGEKQDTILVGTTGIGKTYNIEKAIRELGVASLTLKGNKTMFAFGGDLMLLHSRIPKGQKMALVIDDCDSFFENKENINILKGMTGDQGTRQFQYNKKINDHMFTEAQMSVMHEYQTEGMHGFTVPTEDFIFIFTTNFMLPYESDAKEYTEKHGGSAKANRMQDLAAVRGRFNVKDYLLDMETNWGWIAEVALNDSGLHMLESDSDKMFLLDWMYNNWNNMTETNIRTIEKMAYEMVDYPEDFRDNWEADFLK